MKSSFQQLFNDIHISNVYINKKVIICRDLVTLTSHDPKVPTPDKKFFNIFVPHIEDYQHAKNQSEISMDFQNIF